MIGLQVDSQRLENARKQVNCNLHFLERLLNEQLYFARDNFTLAEVVAGTLIPFLPLENYPHLKAWSDRLSERDSWQQTAASTEVIETALPNIRRILELQL
jgi:glutathione S-transferase